MNERYRTAKVFMTVNIDVLVNDGMTEQEQEQKMTDLAIDYVQCLGDTSVQFEMAEFND
jgi:biotin synthase-like enzyme